MRRAPQRVRALALISTTAAPDTAAETQSRTRQIGLARDGKYDDLVAAAFPSLVDEQNLDDNDLAELWTTMAHEVGAEAFIAQQQAVIQRADSRPILKRITCPTAVIHGTGDRTIEVSNARETASVIPGATLTLIEGAGHMVAQERSAEVVQAFADLLDRAALQAAD